MWGLRLLPCPASRGPCAPRVPVGFRRSVKGTTMIHPRPGCVLSPKLAALQRQYSEWSIWTDPAGNPVATRLRTRLSDAEAEAGMDMTVSPPPHIGAEQGIAFRRPGTPEDLAALLARQKSAERRYRRKHAA